MFIKAQINTWKETDKIINKKHIPAIALHASLPIAESEDLSQRGWVAIEKENRIVSKLTNLPNEINKHK